MMYGPKASEAIVHEEVQEKHSTENESVQGHIDPHESNLIGWLENIMRFLVDASIRDPRLVKLVHASQIYTLNTKIILLTPKY